jgi:Domain of unknown function (DUF4397)
MKKRFLAALGTAVAVAGLALAATPAVAVASPASQHHSPYTPARSSNSWGDHRRGSGPVTDLSLVHGVPNLAVDIYVIKNFSSYKELPDVHFATVADLTAAFPGWVSPGFYVIDVVATGGNPFKPLLITSLSLRPGQSKTVAAYVTANAAGQPGHPTLGVFANDTSPTNGQARVTVRHLAVAPTVGVCANGAVPITTGFSNGQTASAVVPASPPAYAVTVTAPATSGCGSKLAGPISVDLPANTNTLAFAIGTFPSTFTVVTLAVPTST